MVALRVPHSTAAITVELVRRLADRRSAGVQRRAVGCVDVGHVEVEGRLRRLPLASSRAHHDDCIIDADLGVVHGAVGKRGALDLDRSEGPCEKRDQSRNIADYEIGGHRVVARRLEGHGRHGRND